MNAHAEMRLTSGELAGFAETVDMLDFTERCDITRIPLDTGTRDELNHPTAGAAAALHTDLECHYFERTRRERVGPDLVATITDVRLILPAGTDVTERDTIAEVRHIAIVDGAEVPQVITKSRRIDRVVPRSYYVEAVLAGVT